MSMAKKTLEHPVLVFVLFVLIMVVGVFTFSKISIALMPDIEFPMLVVMTSYENAGPESVEKSITSIIESGLASVTNLESMTSSSSEGASLVMLELRYGTDLDVATADVRDKLDRVKRALPDEADTPLIFRMDASAMPIMRIAVRGNRSANDLREIADNQITDLLEQVNGVAQASVSGGRKRIVRAELRANRLEAYGMSLTTIASSLAAQNLELGGGKIEDAQKNYIIRTVGEYDSIEEIANTVVGVKNGYQVRLCDVGDVFWGHEDMDSAVYINGEPGVYISISKASDANDVKVADEVYKKIEEIQRLIPPDITLELIIDNSVEIRDTIGVMLETLVSGVILAMLVLYVFLRSFKSTLIIGISIPISMMMTLIVMNFAGITLNMVTMTGLILGLGMIVDASIVILENIHNYRLRGAKPHISAILGTQEVFTSVFSGNMTTLCVFLPFIIFQAEMGIMGEMFMGMVLTISFALISSLIVASLLVPVLSGHFLPLSNRNETPIRNKILRKFDEVMEVVLDKIAKAYAVALRAAMGHRKVTLGIVLGLLLISVLLLGVLNIRLMPGATENQVELSITMPLGTPLRDTQDVAFQISRIIEKEVEGYETILISVGTGGGMMGNDSTNTASITIKLPTFSEQIDTSDDVKAKLRSHFPEFPSAILTFGRGGGGGGMFGDDIDICIRSQDLEGALDTAKKIQATLKTVDGLSESSIDTTEGLPQIQVEIDRERAYSFGLNVASVAREINASIDGTTATIYREAGNEFDVVVMYRPEDKAELTNLENIFIMTQAGRVPVSNFAKLVRGVGPVSIQRENQARTIHVTANILDEIRPAEMERRIHEAIANTIVIPEGITYTMEGSQEDITEQISIFIRIIILAVLLVFGVMAATYESFLDPFINLATMPLLLIGFVLVHFITRQPISIMSAVGIVMLIGIVVNNGIILVDQINLLVNRGSGVREACIEAGFSRLRPVLMTTLTTVLGMLPFCFAQSGSANMIKPIGFTVIGGLISSTFMTLFVIPVLYSLLHGKLTKKKSLVAVTHKEEVKEDA